MTPTLPIEGFKSDTATVGGVHLHYWLGGDPEGQPIILWHGFLSTSYAWREVAPALANAGHSVLVPDMRGYGDSDKPEGTDGYDARALAKECRALVSWFRRRKADYPRRARHGGAAGAHLGKRPLSRDRGTTLH